jgi:transposase
MRSCVRSRVLACAWLRGGFPNGATGRYADANSIQTLAGTVPVPSQSGKYAKAHKRFACLKPLRNALHQFAWHSTRQEAWALAYYKRKRAEGKTHRMAVRALANVRGAHHLSRVGEQDRLSTRDV